MNDNEFRQYLAAVLDPLRQVGIDPLRVADTILPIARIYADHQKAAELREWAAALYGRSEELRFREPERTNFNFGRADQCRITARALHDRADYLTNPLTAPALVARDGARR